MASNNRSPSRLADARRARGHDIMAKLTRALRPKSVERPLPLPTAEDFERLVDRFECEYTRAKCTFVWSGTWIEILLLSRRLFVDNGDLAEFYARDFAFELLIARNIESITEDKDIRSIVPGDSSVRTLDTIAEAYLSRYGRDDMARNTIFSHLQMVVRAYSSDDTPRLAILDRMIEVLRRKGTLQDDDTIYRIRGYAEYHEREDRYERERAQEREARTSGAVTPVDPADDDA